MRLVAAVLLSGCAALAQPAPKILTADQITELELAAPTVPNRQLLGTSYALVILGITSFDSRGFANASDVMLAAGQAAAHARQMLTDSESADLLGAAGETLWRYKLLNARMISAASMAAREEAAQLAKQTLDRAIAIDPKQQEWRATRITMNSFHSGRRDPADATVWPEARRDLAVLTGITRFYNLKAVGQLAFEAGDFDAASAIGQELLQVAESHRGDWNYGNAVYYGNMLLGQVAAARGDIAAAEKFLLQGSATPGSPQLNSFGPNMLLAQSLLAAGHKEAVLQAFDLDRSFWKMHRGKLDEWAKDVREGKAPMFGPNLLY